MKSSNEKAAFSAEFLQELIDDSLAIDEEQALLKNEKLYRIVKRLAAPTIVGVERIPPGPCLFICNHSAFALDAAAILPILRKETGRYVRGLAHQAFFKNPKLREYVMQTGGLMANPTIGEALLEAGKDILLCPGGSYEATKGASERYRLLWKDRTGFVKLAISQGVPIVPLGVVGPDEWYDSYIERSEVPDSLIGGVMRAMGFSEEYIHAESVPSIPKGLFGSIIPKLKPIFINVGEAIPTVGLEDKKPTKAQVYAIRDKTKKSIESSISDMLILQAQSKEKMGIIRKLVTF